MRTLTVLYMPVIHRGYVDFLKKAARPGAECLLLGEQALRAIGPQAEYLLRKDAYIRALPEDMVQQFVSSLGLYAKVGYHDGIVIPEAVSVILPTEDVSQLAVMHLFKKINASFIQIRLRYDRDGLKREDVVPATPCTAEYVHQVCMRFATEASLQSRDWWLSVGAVIARDGEPLLIAHNEAGLDKDLPNIMGDPRSSFHRGENTEDTLVRHAERGLIAQAAREGIALQGADAYITHFPCVPCATQLAEAGIQRIFFKEGYSRLEAAEILLSRGVQIFRVQE